MKLKSRHLLLCLSFTSAWMTFGAWFATDWYLEITARYSVFFALYVVTFIAIIPGAVQALHYVTLPLIKRSPEPPLGEPMPSVSVLVAAYNEAAGIKKTLESLCEQYGLSKYEILVMDDGSSDNTLAIARRIEKERRYKVRVFTKPNGGKAAALNDLLRVARHDLIVTVDGDCRLEPTALRNLVYAKQSSGAVAVAGTILVENERASVWARMQKWEYCLGIFMVKRVQGHFEDVSVCQGAFSLYDRRVLEEVGGWKRTVGEDIVLSWDILAKDYRTIHCDTAIAFTNVPETAKQLMNQRRRWARGMIEAVKSSPGVMVPKRRFATFSLMNATFPFVDFAYTFILPYWMVSAIFFGDTLIVGNYFYLVLATGVILNLINYRIYVNLMRYVGVDETHDPLGFILYSTLYGFFNQACSLMGYADELIAPKNKNWRTK